MPRITMCVRPVWSRSRAYRIPLIFALIHVLLCLVVHGVYLATLPAPDQNIARKPALT